MEKENQIAVFIDAENINAKHLDSIFTEIKQRGNIAIKRLFGSTAEVKKVEVEKSCLELSIEPHLQYNKVKGKNSSDISLVINAMDVLYSKSIDTFIIVSSDSDFTSLVSRIRENNKSVIGIGLQQTPTPFRNACNEFLFIENLISDDAAVEEPIKVDSKNVTDIDKIKAFIKRKIESNENQEIILSQIQESLKKEYSDFSQKNYGSSKFSDFITKMPEFVVSTKADKTTKVATINPNFKEDTALKENCPPKSLDTINDVIKYVVLTLEKRDNGSINMGGLQKIIKTEYPDFTVKQFKVSSFSKLLKKNEGLLKFDSEEKPNIVMLNS